MTLDFGKWFAKGTRKPVALIRVKHVVTRNILVLAAADLADDFEGQNEYQPEPDTITATAIENRVREIAKARGDDGFEFIHETWNRPTDCLETGEAAVTIAFPNLGGPTA